MNLRRLALRNLWFHRRAHVSVWLGVVITAMILAGALGVGDSVRYSLRQMALARLGGIQWALAPHERLFRDKWAGEIGAKLNSPAASALILPGIASTSSASARANRVQVCGVDEKFWQLNAAPQKIGDYEVLLNERLAAQLNAKIGDDIVLRVEKPTLLGRDAPLSKDDDSMAAMNLKVAAILPDSGIGRFGLQANQVPPYNAFVSLAALQRAVEQVGKANQIFVGGNLDKQAYFNDALFETYTLADTGAQWREVASQGELELRTERVFLDPPLARAALQQKGALPVVGYLLNSIEANGKAIPYSMVAGVAGAPLPPQMRADEVVLNEWAARDLGAKIGQRVTLKYFVMGPGRRLEEKTASFKLRAIVPLTGAARDPDLMPEFPGIAGAENCRDWEPGVSVDLKRIRPQDEKYWDEYKGTPKAFLSLDTARKLFQNRFGDYTAIRFPKAEKREALEKKILSEVTPTQLGLQFFPVRAQALQAGAQGFDFGGLFIAFSFFLIVSALLLTALLFALNAESRAREIGTLLALGFTPKTTRRLLLFEGFFIALLGALPGALLGLGYTRFVLQGLNGVWRGATGTAELQFHAEPSSIIGGAVGAVFMALFAIWLVARQQAAAPARALLNGNSAVPEAKKKTAKRRLALGTLPVAAALLVAALLMLSFAATRPAQQQAGLFFGAGALLLIAIATGCNAYLSAPIREASLTLSALAFRNIKRRRARSIAVILLLSCASFLIAAVGANRHDPLSDETLQQRTSGTGGFALWMETSLPIYQDLNGTAGREQYGLEADSSFVPLRVREGDDASCLNLNRAQTPSLWGVNAAQLQQLNAFGADWKTLDEAQPDGAIAAYGDENTIVWGLGLGRGSTLQFVDENGKVFTVRIAGLVNKTILQGGLLISEKNFIERFPSSGGYRAFLIDAPQKESAKENSSAVSKELSEAFVDFGAEVMPAARRLSLFQTVENTYLAIFQALGGLGLLLGSVGLGVVVLRNVLERRGELALLRAVGWQRALLEKMIFLEHAALALMGLGAGVLAGVVAMVPLLRDGQNAPLSSLVSTFGAVALSALIWTWLATRLATRGALLEALRNE